MLRINSIARIVCFFERSFSLDNCSIIDNVGFSHITQNQTIVNGGDGIMQYRIQLDTKNQLFVAIDAHDQNHFGTGRTIEQAIHNLKATSKAA